jgi:hypothetical protein
MADTRMDRYVHYDMQDDEKLICTYADLGLGPAVVFDGAGFMDPVRLRAFIEDLMKAADWLDKSLASSGKREPNA